MRVLLFRLMAVSVAATVAAIPACGSNTSSPPPKEHEDAGAGGHKGTGGTTSDGGASGASGSAGAGGAITGCDTTSCDQLGLSTVGIKSCCVSATKCGIDTSSFSAFVSGLPACVDPSSITLPTTTTTTPVTVLDGGIIPVSNGLPVQLDSTCPGIDVQGTNDSTGQAVTIDMPGCCRPETNTCGASTHKLAGAGTAFPISCASYDDVATSAAGQFGGGVTIPDDPNVRCKYTAAPVGVPDSGAPDTGAGDNGSGGAAGGGGNGGDTGTGGSAGAGGTDTGGAGGTNAGGAAGTNTGGAAGSGGTATGGAAGSGGTATGGAAGAGGAGGTSAGGAGGTSGP